MFRSSSIRSQIWSVKENDCKEFAFGMKAVVKAHGRTRGREKGVDDSQLGSGGHDGFNEADFFGVAAKFGDVE